MFSIFFCFLLPLLGAIRINLVGELNLAEPIVVVVGLVSLRRFGSTSFRNPVSRRIIILGLVWLFAQVVSDIYRGSPQEDFLRGWFKILVLLLSYIACSVFVGGNLKRAFALVAGVILQPVVNYFIYHPDVPFYKFILGTGVSLMAFWITMLLRGERRPWALFVPVCVGMLALYLDCRSLCGITICAAAYYTLICIGLLREETGLKRRLFVGVFWGAVSLSMINIYSALATSGNLSEQGLQKYEDQVNEKGRFSILSGRGEIYFSLPKIMQSPIVGWGSWAKDYAYVGQRAEELGLDPVRAVNETGGLIPAHSHIFGSWLEAGIAGAIFWGYIIFLIIRLFVTASLGAILQWSGVYAFVFTMVAWDILFSPFGGERRFNDGLYLWILTLVVMIVSERRQRVEAFRFMQLLDWRRGRKKQQFHGSRQRLQRI